MATLLEDSKSQAEGLGVCFECGHEYRDDQVSHEGKDNDVSGESNFCPNCKLPEHKIYYFYNEKNPYADFQEE